MLYSEALIALYFIHGAGWVHRADSIGDMAIYEYERRGLLQADFEYAKKTNREAEREVKTVSLFFPYTCTSKLNAKIDP